MCRLLLTLHVKQRDWYATHKIPKVYWKDGLDCIYLIKNEMSMKHAIVDEKGDEMEDVDNIDEDEGGEDVDMDEKEDEIINIDEVEKIPKEAVWRGQIQVLLKRLFIYA